MRKFDTFFTKGRLIISLLPGNDPYLELGVPIDSLETEQCVNIYNEQLHGVLPEEILSYSRIVYNDILQRAGQMVALKADDYPDLGSLCSKPYANGPRLYDAHKIGRWIVPSMVLEGAKTSIPDVDWITINVMDESKQRCGAIYRVQDKHLKVFSYKKQIEIDSCEQNCFTNPELKENKLVEKIEACTDFVSRLSNDSALEKRMQKEIILCTAGMVCDYYRMKGISVAAYDFVELQYRRILNRALSLDLQIPELQIGPH